MKNYYVILGIPTDADLEEIRAAYRRLAKELHPDYYGRDSGPFIDLQEAYAVLSDPQRRRAYDKACENRRLISSSDQMRFGEAKAEPLFTSEPKPEPLFPEQPWTDIGDYSLKSSFRTVGPSFEELFDRLWRNFSLSRPKTERLRSISVEIRISPHEAMQGGRARILVPARLQCPHCRGRGGIGFFDCWRCDGFGFIQGEYPVTITFPAGIVNNYVAEIPLDRLGITNFYLRAVFTVSGT